MTYEQAVKKAREIIDNEYQTINEIIELNDSWVFLSSMRNGDPIIGAMNIRIYKGTDNIENFPIPPLENLHLLRSGKTIFKLEL